MANRQFAPQIKDAIDYTLELKPFRKFTLDNGIAVYAIGTGFQRRQLV